ncbi:MAG: phosphoribosylaminoimidazole-succinocarboxamide synthase [Thermoanaerobacter sp.]|jgi:phosphoribosylaminoimidazole-succinocarboxamide synthase|uniref:phosphoribosylaminoimidazolesuccinocarboxamide synthase n=1 Tax=Desulfofundulus thermocisternus TaxID=42471 RepID=UPI000488C33F|nr:phosphoribosylaminoimidazolesuccinocarboxamide synthase [Desulfofundulus thermocisternus]MDK2887496.1 phosphoribosylaminoimidazole-succinocarboxamide synthase [Thermoanaerobacter sp.]
MQKGELLYEGKAKKVYRTDDPGVYLVEYKDDATAFNGLKKGVISGKGELNNKISAHFFRLLEEKGIATHFVEQVGEREMLVRALEIIPVEVVVRNIAAGSLARRLGLDEGTALPRPVVEYYYKSDELGDPMINDDHIAVLNLATGEEMSAIKKVALSVNEILRSYLTPRNLELVDFKLEFGRHEGKILLGDEISPDTCRFWDARTKEKLDKDRFRRDLGGVEEAYQEVWRRLVG